MGEVYRYLLEHTTPKEVYENHIKPYLQEGHIYTWQDMKENTPPEYWFHSIENLKTTLQKVHLKLVEGRINQLGAVVEDHDLCRLRALVDGKNVCHEILRCFSSSRAAH